MIVHDLPQLYTKPTAQALLDALQILQKPSNSFDHDLFDPAGSHHKSPKIMVEPSGVPRYLTGIVSSPLSWLDEDARELIWEAASLRLSERSGRTAAPSMERYFEINRDLTVVLFEPSITEDSLGLKTWTSSLLLSRRLAKLSKHVPPDHPKLLELGSGTGLVGIAAAASWRDMLSTILLTDLPEIISNLQKNIEKNEHLFHTSGAPKSTSLARCRVLNWADESDGPENASERYELIIAADPIYSLDHPRLFVDTVRRWLTVSSTSRFILEVPLRNGFTTERADLRRRLESFMFIVEEGTEIGYDDWELADGQPAEVECWWSVWQLQG